MVMGAASGYPDYSGSLIAPILTDQILHKFTCRSKFMDITTGSHLDQLKRCGEAIRFQRDTEAIARPLIKNQKLEPDFLDADYVWIRSNKGLYYDLKIDKADLHQICNSQEKVNNYVNKALQQFEYGMELDVLSQMVLGADLYNQGNCAGVQSGCYTLGTEGEPLCIGVHNILEWFCHVYSVLYEACVVTPGHNHMVEGPGDMGSQPFMTLPIEGYNLLKQRLSMTNGCQSIDTTPLVTGRIPEAIQNFHIFLSQHLPFQRNQEGEKVYMLPSGRRDATGFCVTIDDSRQMEEACHWGVRYQGMVTWASGVLYPEALALSRVKFDKIDLNAIPAK